MRPAPAQIRFAWAMLTLVLLALRCLAPAGFMPAFDHGAVTIVACPDAAGAAPSRMHHGEHKSLHQPCPYASAASLGAIGPDWIPLLPIVALAIALLLGRTFLFVGPHATRERPPSRGPPIPA